MKLEAVDDHPAQQADISAPLRLHDRLAGDHEQQNNHDADENGGGSVERDERRQTLFQNQQHEHCIDQHERLAREVEQVELFDLAQCEQNVETNQDDQLKRNGDRSDANQFGWNKTKPIGSQACCETETQSENRAGAEREDERVDGGGAKVCLILRDEIRV